MHVTGKMGTIKKLLGISEEENFGLRVYRSIGLPPPRSSLAGVDGRAAILRPAALVVLGAHRFLFAVEISFKRSLPAPRRFK